MPLSISRASAIIVMMIFAALTTACSPQQSTSITGHVMRVFDRQERDHRYLVAIVLSGKDVHQLALSPTDTPLDGRDCTFAIRNYQVESFTCASAKATLPMTILEVPSLGIKTRVIVSPRTELSWDFSAIWKVAGWLEGTAKPGQQGNTVIGAHVDTVFKCLTELQVNDQIIITSGGQRFVYEMRRSYRVQPTNMKPISQAWHGLTLMTCNGTPVNGQYPLRYVVQAKLIEVQEITDQ